MEDIKLIDDTETKYYEVFEELKELDELTIDLFNNEDFGIEDIDDLVKLKYFLKKLDTNIEVKINEVYSEIINKDF